MSGNRQFVLGVDLDGVVADFTRGMKPIAAEWLGVSEKSLTDEISYGFPEWRLERSGGYDALHRFAVKERQLFAQLPPMPGAPAALRRLSAVGDIRIRIITHRFTPGFTGSIPIPRIGWSNGIPYWTSFMRDKRRLALTLC